MICKLLFFKLHIKNLALIKEKKITKQILNEKEKISYRRLSAIDSVTVIKSQMDRRNLSQSLFVSLMGDLL